MYNVLVCRLKNVRKHPGADRLQIAEAANNLVIVGMDAKESDLGLFFPPNGQLSTEYATANNLIAKFDENGKKIAGTGFFDENRRVRKQAFRKVKSDGYFAELSSLNFTGGDISTLKEHDQFTEFNGIPIASKYLTPATIKAMKAANSGNKNKVKRGTTVMFHKHKDTAFAERELYRVKKGDLLTITLKIHGSSARTINALDEFPKYSLRIQKIFNWFGYNPVVQKWTILNGSRNVILEKRNKNSKGYYQDESFRTKCADSFSSLLKKGEVVYYEIIGWDGPEHRIMPSVETSATDDKEFIKRYGPIVNWDWNLPQGTCDIYVYRIANVNVDGIEIDLPWNQMVHRCSELGLKHVPVLEPTFIYDGDEKALLEKIRSHTIGDDTIYPKQPREGCVLRVDHSSGTSAFKSKSWFFYKMEGFMLDKPDYIDTEEIS